jgi:cholesterol transport system auxiliary component
MTQWATRIAAVGLLAGLLCGCGGRANPTDERRFFLLEAERGGAARRERLGEVLVVRRFDAAPGFGSGELAYRIGDHAFESDYYHLFLQPPGGLVAEQARRWLSRSGLFGAVVNPGSEVLPTQVLEGNVTKLYADFHPSVSPRAVMVVEFFLLEAGESQTTVVFHEEYEASHPLRAQSGAAVVEAHNQCLTEILRKFEADLRGLAKDLPRAR